MNIRDYLSKEARRITDSALADYTDKETWQKLFPERHRQYMEMMGLEDLPPYDHRPPLNVKVTGVVERQNYRIEKLYYESLPKLYVTANLYLPTNLTSRAPGVLYVCGHSQNQKVHYQAHPRRFAELGFVCLIVETLQLGEVKGYHHGCYHEGWFNWYSRGYSSANIELLNGIRGLDLLAGRSEVDANRLGITGISGGGATSWWVAAADNRVQVSAPVCGTATLASHIYDRTIDGHCDCMWWVNIYRWDLADVGALIAPRPMMIASANRDSIFTIESIREVYNQLKTLYEMLGATDKLQLIETPGPHSYHEKSRTAIFSWFIKHLQGKDVPPDRVGDIDASPEKWESEETLRVFVNGSPKDNRTPTIQDDIFKPPTPPTILSRSDLNQARQKAISELRKKTFGFFPAKPAPLDMKVEFEFATGSSTGVRFAFNSETEWRLHGQLTIADSVKAPAPVVVALRQPKEERRATENFVGRIRVPWAKAVVEPRGSGETAWSEDLQWHLRRATAWTGRTIASMRVYDVLRALEAVRALTQVDETKVSLAASGEMTVVALYAGLLDGQIQTLFLENPVATQNAPSGRDGRGEAVEMLNCLKITDLTQVAGLLFPTELVFIGEYPDTYNWAKELYNKLGMAEKFIRIDDLGEYKT